MAYRNLSLELRVNWIQFGVLKKIFEKFFDLRRINLNVATTWTVIDKEIDWFTGKDWSPATKVNNSSKKNMY